MNLDCYINAFQQDVSIQVRKCSGEKLSKICITGLAAANAVGEKLLMFVVGKAKNPRCFKNIKFLPCRYRNSAKTGWIAICLKRDGQEFLC